MAGLQKHYPLLKSRGISAILQTENRDLTEKAAPQFAEHGSETGRRGWNMKNREHRKKMLAPVVITVVFILYLIGYGIALAVATEWSPVMLLIAVPLVALGIGMVYTLKSRIKEIRSGEEDDLGNY